MINNILMQLHNNSQTQREKGTYFENLIVVYFTNEPKYQDLYKEVLTYQKWAERNNISKADAGIDLVAITKTGENHAIQCKFYDANYTIRKGDIDSFFTASGKKDFSHRIIVATTNHYSKNAEDAFESQSIPVQIVDLYELESSILDWEKYYQLQEVVLKPKKQLRQHQKDALQNVENGFCGSSRGKLIMACGTGKTFTSLKIAEKIAGSSGSVLFLVPSLSLLSQSLTEWTQESEVHLCSFAVCSDSDVGKKKNANEDSFVTNIVHELKYPATTNAKALSDNCNLRRNEKTMTVVFSTYHSIDVINKAQQEYGLPEFDLIICDEAHRTTGATFESEDESHFVKVHNDDFISAKKRLYMTATPKIYGEVAKAKSIQENIALASMDDKGKFGEVFYTISFSEAVRQKLLVDYKVIVLSVDESYISERLGDLLQDENHQLPVDDAAKIVGCWKALSKQGTIEEEGENYIAMKRAVAFAQIIEPTNKTKGKKTSSKAIAKMFEKVVERFKESELEYLSDEEKVLPSKQLACKARHVDGSMNATEKQEKINWLKEDSDNDVCKILSNVRCLSEGVDVPSLDAVLFLTPKNSKIDVVQSVGRVMRNSPNKKIGYVILPIVIPAHLKPEEVLNDNKTYKVVWDTLNALRAHDDRFDSMINKANLIGLDKDKIEIIEISNKINKKIDKNSQQKLEMQNLGKSRSIGSSTNESQESPTQENLFKIEIGDLERALVAKMVEKCGERGYWESWANDIAEIANSHITRINQILSNPQNTCEIKAFDEFLSELHDDLNDSISKDDAIEMLAQHLITKPVFEALFADYEFAKNNPVSRAMQKINDELSKHRLEKETKHLEGFYDSVKRRVAGLEQSDTARQKIIIELYDKFFKNAFPKMTEKLGIVYTPVEVVDFIIHSVADVLKSEFNQELGDENIHIIDPFTGTGTFITRLLQSGLIPKEKLLYKFQNEIHANEIVLLAYYIAAINIESTFHQITKEGYQPFNGICLTDTFSLFTKEDLINRIFVDNSKRRKRQKELDIRIIIGNPPYSAGQKSANDNNKQVEYPALDERIAQTYEKHSKAALTRNLYDSYIRSFRFASDKIKDAGVIGFVSSGSFLDGNSMDGLRKCLKDEFSKIYIFNLRGNQRTAGEISRKEGGKIFGGGSRTPIAISILIKNPKSKEQGRIYYYDIGDYLTREEKLEKVKNFISINAINFSEITPDAHNDWINQRNSSFYEFMPMGGKKEKGSAVIFNNYSLGVATNRDTWCYNFSKEKLSQNMQNMINFYNGEVERFKQEKLTNSKINIDDFVNNNPEKISWSVNLKNSVKNEKQIVLESNAPVLSLYRPFCKQYLYYSKHFNERQSQIPQIFPHKKAKNLVICAMGIGARMNFSALITDTIPDLEMVSKAQCFPLYLYEKQKNTTQQNLLEPQEEAEYKKTDAITDDALKYFTDIYSSQPSFAKFTKEDLFYYIYGLLHSKEYREQYADNLSKQLPRIPAVKNFDDFMLFSQSGRKLADIHINYEQCKKHPLTIEYLGKEIKSLQEIPEQDLLVEKMKFPKNGKITDKTTIIYNNKITLKNIPIEAFEYEVNGRPAIDWVLERQCVSINKDSNIVNDANDFAIQTQSNPAYIIELLQSIISVSIQTIDIVESMPKLEMV